MDTGVLKVSATAEAEIEADKAFILVTASSDTLVFGNAAVSASEDLRAAIDSIKRISAGVDVETESVATDTSTGVFGKNSTATYTVKLTVTELSTLGAILGVCSDGKKLRVQSIRWHYDDEQAKLELSQQAVRKAKHKADAMMAAIDYIVVGIRTCSDSYSLPNSGEVIFPEANSGALASAPTAVMKRARGSSSVDIGTQFTSKKTITAICSAEFLVKAKNSQE